MHASCKCRIEQQLGITLFECRYMRPGPRRRTHGATSHRERARALLHWLAHRCGTAACNPHMPFTCHPHASRAGGCMHLLYLLLMPCCTAHSPLQSTPSSLIHPRRHTHTQERHQLALRCLRLDTPTHPLRSCCCAQTCTPAHTTSGQGVLVARCTPRRGRASARAYNLHTARQMLPMPTADDVLHRQQHGPPAAGCGAVSASSNTLRCSLPILPQQPASSPPALGQGAASCWLVTPSSPPAAATR